MVRVESYGLVLREEGSGERRVLEIFWGPQHPSSGHTRFIVEVEGDIVVNVTPDPGYVHRTMEKLGETRHWIQNIPLFERISLPDAINVTWAYVMAIEKLLGLDVPKRAQYLRVIMAELSRISTHLYDLGIHSIMIGSSTGYMWAFGLRELLVHLWAMVTGSRTTPTWILPGGARTAPPDAFYTKTKEYLNYLEKKIDEFVTVVIKNPVGYYRLRDVGYLSREDAARYMATGPGARGSGIDWDARRDYKYGAYGEFEWSVCVEDGGDSLARTLVRICEIKQSARIIRQALEKVPRDGPLVGDALLGKMPPKLREMASRRVKLTALFLMRLPPAEAVGVTEGGRGRFLFHVLGDGTERPHRVRITTPSWQNLRAMIKAFIGSRLMDLPAIYGSFGYFPPEQDR
ncbi:MAG: NADH-quinone oxidoreductase subunit D [Thermoproteaceae archaeon]|nr:NADH-quinone oxidoreductase subunit D [Thermoproteaceae archaeon]